MVTDQVKLDRLKETLANYLNRLQDRLFVAVPHYQTKVVKRYSTNEQMSRVREKILALEAKLNQKSK